MTYVSKRLETICILAQGQRVGSAYLEQLKLNPGYCITSIRQSGVQVIRIGGQYYIPPEDLPKAVELVERWSKMKRGRPKQC